MVQPRKLLVAAFIFTAKHCPYASSADELPSRSLGTPPGLPTSSSGLAPGSVLSSPTGGQISFRTKTRNGVRGLLPQAPKLRLWGKKGQEEGLDTAKRFLHITADALVLEVEGVDECLSIARGPESMVGARVTVVARKDAGIDPGEAASNSSTAGQAPTKIPVDGLFGVYNLLSGPFVAVISRSKLRYANHDLGVEFRQVAKVRLIPVLSAPRVLDDAQAKEEARLLALLALAFRSHQFYFSHAHDVTQTLQTLRVSYPTSSLPASAATTPRRGATLPHSSSSPSSLGALSSGGKVRKDAKQMSPLSKGTKRKRGSNSGSGSSGGGGRRRRGRQRSTAAAAVAAAEATAAEATAAEATAAEETAAPPTPPPPDSRFFWNVGVLGPLLELRDELGTENIDTGRNRGAGAAEAGAGVEAEAAVAAVDRWLTPVMSGFLQVERGCQAGERSFDVMFVSRRSRLRQGTRYTRRGIDDGGNVANFVETEQSLLHEDKSVTSHVQIRGSIPVLWSSPTNLRYHPKVRIDPDQEASLRALRRHSEDLIRLYGKNGGGVVFVNLVDKKNEQGVLGEAFDAALKAVEDGAGAKAEFALGKENDASGLRSAAAAAGGGAAPKLAGSLRHVWFDFHHECRNMHWENLDKLLAIVDREFGQQGFYHAGPGGEILSVQDGVVRTNCMDCLDRTNVVQSLLARRSMLVQLRAVGVDIPPEPQGGDSAALALTLDMLEMPAEELERRFRDVWGNNADEISMLYAGTPALKGDFTRTGQRTKMGLLQDGTNSAIRYVVNNFQDHRRQESVDLLLGVNRPVVDEAGNILGEFIQEPLDLDLWATRVSQPQQPQQPQQQQQQQQPQQQQQQQHQQHQHQQQHKEEEEQSSAAATATGKRGGGGGAAGLFPHPAAFPSLWAPSGKEGVAPTPRNGTPEEIVREVTCAAGVEGGAGAAAKATNAAGTGGGHDRGRGRGRRRGEERSSAREKACGRKEGESQAKRPLRTTWLEKEAQLERARKTQQRSGPAPPIDRRRWARPEGPE